MTARRESFLYLLALASAAWAVAFLAGASASRAAVCPSAGQGETPQDCPWAGVARELLRDIQSGKPDKEIAAKLTKLLPQLDRQLREDAGRQAWKKFWGQSINFDELAGGEIVHPAILKAIAAKLKIVAPQAITNIREQAAPAMTGLPFADPSGHPLAHAGMEHTYGYLFSVLKTSFGYKRARWVEGEIERGFGLPEGVLGPMPSSGTLFANVTYFAGRIAFRDDARRTALLKEGARKLPAALRGFDFGDLKPVRLEETVEAAESGPSPADASKGATGDVRKVTLRTDFVPFKTAQKNTHLLVYSVLDPSYGGALLITAFPVNAAFVETALKAEDLGEGKPVKTRYNAFVEGVTGKTLTGTRRVAP